MVNLFIKCLESTWSRLITKWGERDKPIASTKMDKPKTRRGRRPGQHQPL
jgi:hypothetical protein